MKFAREFLFISLSTFASCGPLVSNTDKPTGIYLATPNNVAGDFGVKISDSKPSNGGVEITGVSCKNKLWEPAPDNETAVAVLKREVNKDGFNTVFITSIVSDPNALAKNCWSAIVATGIAFNS